MFSFSRPPSSQSTEGHTIRKLDSSTGLVSVYAGTGQYYPFTEGALTSASFSSPTHIAIDPSGQFYVSDMVGPLLLSFWMTKTLIFRDLLFMGGMALPQTLSTKTLVCTSWCMCLIPVLPALTG